MAPPGNAIAFDSLRRTTAVLSGIGRPAACSMRPISRSSAALPAFSLSASPHSNGLSDLAGLSMARTCASTAMPSWRSTDSGITGASRSTSAGSTTMATKISETVAAKVQAMILLRERRSVTPLRSMPWAYSSILAASAASRTSSRASTASRWRPRRSTPSGADIATSSG